MRHDKLQRELNLLLLLTENQSLTVDQICRKQDLSRRNLYYYLEFFRDSGFIVSKHGSSYSIDRDSPFFKHLFETINFTEDEALTLLNILDKVDDRNALTERIRKKLDRFYDLNILSDPDVKIQAAHHVSVIYEAIKSQRLIKIKGYSSPHSKTTTDRVVEPFLFLNNNNEIRAYELSSGSNKTFKISRMQDIEVLDLNWENASKHKQVFTDVFLFSGEETHPVELDLDQLAYHLLMEEIPQASQYITPGADEQHWHLKMEVVSYLGIGRFVLGLYQHVTVLGDDAFKAYLREEIQKML